MQDRPDAVLPRPPGTVAPISADQEHVWLHAATSPDLPLYNEAITIHRKGSFDAEALESSFNEVVRRNEIWRTSFEQREDRVVQVVHDRLRVRLPVTDLSVLPLAEREAEALRLAMADAWLPFDLTKPPLFRTRLVRMDSDVHRLYLALHHIIFDGVTIYRLFLPALIAGYDAVVAGRVVPPAPSNTLQYGDYAVWRERQLATRPVARQLDYWRDKLSGVQGSLRLASDRPYPAAPTRRGGMERFALPPALTRSLEALGRSHGATLYMVLLAAFGALLHRTTGMTDIAVGGVTDTRRRPELTPMMGYFLNSVVLRTQPTGDLPFRGYVHQVRRTLLEALDNGDVPFAHVVRALQPTREPGRHPLFNVACSIQPPAPLLPEGWGQAQMDVPPPGAKFDLHLELEERLDGTAARFLYSRDLFDPVTIRRMIGNFLTLAEAAAADPDCTLARLPLLTPSETRQLLEWNDTSQPVAHMTLHGWFEAHARQTPDAVAVRCEDEAWTYRRLDQRAGQLAARLRAAGVARGTLTAVCVSRSPDMVASLLAVLKAGAAYLPLDPDLPKARLRLLLNDARPAALLAERRLLSILPEYRDLIVALDDGDAAGVSAMDESAADADAPAGSEADDLAYVIYTSGSTGTPKGVEVLHRGVVNLLASAQRNPGFGARDTLLAVATVSFDMAVLELFLPLVSGGCVALASRSDALDPRRLMALVDWIKPTLMAATPATWRALLDAGWSGSGDLRILCGGEAWPRDLANRLAARCARLWNIYGPTEATIYSTIGVVEPGVGPVPIGWPVANTKTLILDAHGQAVPVGVAGELHIAGAGLARGYRGRPDLTEERFVFSAALPGTRLYRTGDIARHRHDGAIEFLGRNDDQVKIRGFRIELGEVEAALTRLPGVAAAAVKAWPDATGERALTAYLIAEPGTTLDWGALRRDLEQVLPAYMVPSRHLSLSALPLSANHKLDRAALPEPDLQEARPVAVEPTGE
jgi:amino acid adenylation domain-containing protein